MTPVYTHAVVQSILALSFLLVTRISDPSVRLQENSGAEIFFAVPPVRRARGAAARAENALIEAIELAAVGLRLAIFTTLDHVNFCISTYKTTYIGRWCVALKVWFNGAILLVEEGEIWNEVLDDVGMRQWVNSTLLASVGGNSAQACKSVDTIDIHRTRPTNALSARPSERQCGIDLVLDANQSVQHHWARLVQVEGVRLHLRLRGRLIRVPPVDMKGLDSGIFC